MTDLKRLKDRVAMEMVGMTWDDWGWQLSEPYGKEHPNEAWEKVFSLLQNDDELNAVRELLAVLHRDGGHYTMEHGLLKSIQDAQELLHKQWILKEVQ